MIPRLHGLALMLLLAARTSAQDLPAGRLFSSIDIALGGRLKVDTSWDDSNVNPGEYVLFVNPEGRGNPENDGDFNINPKESRFWCDLGGPKADWLTTSGRVEWDFYGNGGTANKASLLLRHLYLKLDFPRLGLSALFGQTNDVISPLAPSTLNYSVLWDQGNIGYRRPQLRLTKRQAVGGFEVVLDGALTRTIDTDSLTMVTPNSAKNGEQSEIPTVQGRLGLVFPFLFEKKGTAGVSGHYGHEHLTDPVTMSMGQFQTWSVNADVLVPITRHVAFSGEWFLGKNLASYFGGIGQGVDLTNFSEIPSEGGWLQVKVTPGPAWEINIGWGVDDPRNSDLSAEKRKRNEVVFSNVRYTLIQGLVIGIEYSHFQTDYVGGADGSDNRVQFSTIYSF